MPQTGIKKTADGIVFATGVVRALGWLGIVTIAALTYVIRTSDTIRNAVPSGVFYDTTKSVRDTTQALRRDLMSVALQARDASRRSEAVGCYLAKYPAGLCDDVPRASQAGQPRRTP